jgi:hypothetical protein
MLQCSKQEHNALGFGHLNLDHWKLPFDLAQDGELVEPFRISCFGFRISYSPYLAIKYQSEIQTQIYPQKEWASSFGKNACYNVTETESGRKE